MTYSKLGFNIHPHGLPQEATNRLYNSIAALNSTVSLVLNNSTFAHSLKAARPDTEVVLRLMPSWGGVDDDMHLKNQPASAHADWYEMHLSDRRIICHGTNEPQPDPTIDAVINWSVEFGQACVKRGLRACIWNTGTGKINETNVHKLRPLIELVNQHPGKLYLGTHEYTNYEWRKMSPWLMGSFKFIHDYCDSIGLKRPEIIITEWGYDTRHMHPSGGQWNTREAIAYTNAIDAAQNLIDACQMYVGHDNIVGVCFFCYGSESSTWQTFDLTRNAYPAFMDYLVDNWPRETATAPDVPDTPDTPDVPDAPGNESPPSAICDVLRWLLKKFCGEDCK